MTHEFEQQVADMLNNRVADLPTAYEVEPATLTRARRRRTGKLGALATAMVVVAAGMVAGVAHTVDRSHSDRVVSTAGKQPSVPTVACPITYNITPESPLAPPSTTPRSVPGDSSVLSGFASYASTDDPRYVVLAPKGWACHTIIGADGQNVSLLAPTEPRTSLAEVSIVNDFLWHGAVGSEVACWVTTDLRVQRYVQENYPELAPSCHRTGRTITQVDAHITTFVDPSTRGAAWIVLPSSDRADDGKVSVLTCHASDPGITVAECDAIVADWVARVRGGT